MSEFPEGRYTFVSDDVLSDVVFEDGILPDEDEVVAMCVELIKLREVLAEVELFQGPLQGGSPVFQALIDEYMAIFGAEAS